jgi:hypothetical protein
MRTFHNLTLLALQLYAAHEIEVVNCPTTN